MTRRVFLILTIVCLGSIHSTQSFTLGKRAHNNNVGANKLAEALKVIQTQKRRMAAEDEGNRGNYQGTPEMTSKWGYPWGVREEEPPQGYMKQLPEFIEPQQQAELSEDYYGEDYSNSDAGALAKLLEYYYDLGYNAKDKSNKVEEADTIKEADKAEMQQLFDTDEKEKKNIDWTPKALGFEGLKHKRADIEDTVREEGAVDGEDRTGEEASEDEGSLSDDDVKELLSDAKNTEIKSMSSEMKLENVNGKETVSANEIVDLLKDDGKGSKKEFIIESKVPEQKPDQENLNKELLVEELPASTGITVKHKRAGVDQLLGGDDNDPLLVGRDEADEAGAYVPTEVELLRECLIKYIELEDRENTALAEALNWATKAQYDQTDSYIPMQVQYLKNAVNDEQVLVELRRKCFGLAEETNEINDGEEDDIESVDKRAGDDEFPLIDEGPVTETQMIGQQPQLFGDGNQQPELFDDGYQQPQLFGDDGYEDDSNQLVPFDTNIDEDNAISDELTKEEIAAFIQEELRKMLLRKGLKYPDNEEDDMGGQWLQGSVDDGTDEAGFGDLDDDKEWRMNPFLRELINRYRSGKFSKRSGDDESTIADTCPAVTYLSDDCEVAGEAGLILDDEAINLCNRHKLCYECGAEHGIRPSTCDKGFLGEAYGLCQYQSNEDDCIEEADVLFKLMFQTHQYVRDSDPICEAQCTLEYITGDMFRKKK